MRALGWLVLAGCNQLLEIDPTTQKPIDAPSQLLSPPADAGPCHTPPDYTSLAFDERAALDNEVPGIAMARVDGVPRMFASHVDSGFIGTIVDWDLAGTPAVIPQLTVPSGSAVFEAVGASPEGAALWSQLQNRETILAVRAAGWARSTPDFGLPASTTVIPGSVGYYAGTARMVVAATATGATEPTLVELTSPDGEHWTSLGPVGFSASLVDAPSLSVDGCVLTYGDGLGHLHVSYRDPGGTFMATTEIQVSPTYLMAFSPVVSLDASEVWFVVNRGVPSQAVFVRGHH